MKEYTSRRWICVQKQDNGNFWYYEPSTSFTRKESIRRLIKDTNTLNWRKAKSNFSWSCIKVQLTFTPITQP